jgi:hypothetical protein
MAQMSVTGCLIACSLAAWAALHAGASIAKPVFVHVFEGSKAYRFARGQTAGDGYGTIYHAFPGYLSALGQLSGAAPQRHIFIQTGMRHRPATICDMGDVALGPHMPKELEQRAWACRRPLTSSPHDSSDLPTALVASMEQFKKHADATSRVLVLFSNPDEALLSGLSLQGICVVLVDNLGSRKDTLPEIAAMRKRWRSELEASGAKSAILLPLASIVLEKQVSRELQSCMK